jgi:GGDEF domain-containing protein
MSLAFVEIDAFDGLLMQIGPAGVRDVLAALTAAIDEWTDKRFRPLLVSDSRLAMLWEDCSRREAVQLSRDLLSQLRVWPQGRTRTKTVKLTVSIGLATLDAVPKNYVSRQIIDAAKNCLSSAKLSGGNTVKSIEV